MNVYPISQGSALSTNATYPISRTGVVPQGQVQPDTVRLSRKRELSEEEAQQAMVEVEKTLSNEGDIALAVHEGLSYNRVMNLLEGL